MSEDAELEVLLSLDGASWEAAEGVYGRIQGSQDAEDGAKAARHQLRARDSRVANLLCVSTTLTLRSGQAAGS